ncbi:hypothetical protein HYALB_00010990 [Hymenoscyphus albidus]|uniref:U3 small nucleolar ribonucleoprotein protein IMP4 n=1 Tax=Hymenoscyphus albidus TaxID=595503 RepID=A0A9N9Q3K1_9HELO|nr:hypothetical protein HYALB_00010990 [Hymenoscyphus albidus]
MIVSYDLILAIHLRNASTTANRVLLSLYSRKQARQRRDYLYRRALTLRDAEISEKRAKLRSSLASGKPLDPAIANDKTLREDYIYDESRPDRTVNEDLDLDDEYAQLSGIVDPRVLVTTSRDPSTRLSSFAKEIRLLLPTSIRLNRGNLILPNLVQSAQASGLSDIVLLHEHRGTPTALTLSHFPHGPTVSFSLHNVVLRHDIPNSSRGTVSESYPHLIFEGFTSRLGQRIVKVLKHIFPPRDAITNKTKIGSRVVTFKNIEDSIEVRHHVFVKTGYQSVELAEVGPRMTMRCFEIRGGTLDNKDGDTTGYCLFSVEFGMKAYQAKKCSIYWRKAGEATEDDYDINPILNRSFCPWDYPRGESDSVSFIKKTAEERCPKVSIAASSTPRPPIPRPISGRTPFTPTVCMSSRGHPSSTTPDAATRQVTIASTLDLSSSRPVSRTTSRTPSVDPKLASSNGVERKTGGEGFVAKRAPLEVDEFSDFGDDFEDMDDRRPPLHRPTDGRSHQPLLRRDDGDDVERGRAGYSSPDPSIRPPFLSRRSTMRSRSPDTQAKLATRKKYTYAAFFLGLSLVSFVVQTETAVYIQSELGWNKAYCMLYLTHGSWSLLWPFQLLILRLQKWKMPWKTFWRRHVYLVWTTAQMVETQELSIHRNQHSPIPYMLRMTAFVTTALTVAGGSWYIAVDMTSASDLTAIYNCSAFFAYAFSVPMLKEKLRLDKSFAVVVAIVGVMIIAYGDSGEPGDVGGGEKKEAKNRLAGNLIIGFGSVLYGFYEVLYKKLACPPEGTSPGRGMVFANTFGSLIGCFTLFVLWIPLPILHILGWETFELPHGEAARLLVISVLANATFSGSFLVLISLTSPVLSSVAALLTIFLVGIADWIFTGKALNAAAIFGGCLIIGAFLLLTYSTYREMAEESRKKQVDLSSDSDSDKGDP